MFISAHLLHFVSCTYLPYSPSFPATTFLTYFFPATALIEEYQRLMSNASPKEVQSGPSLPPAEESFDVSVVMDEDQGTNMYSHELAPGDCIHADVVDVEVVMHSPFLAGY